MKGFSEFGYLFSEYRSEHYRNGIAKKDLPKIVNVDSKTGSVEKIGDTNLTDVQIKHAIEQRKVIIAKFWDRDDEWHCIMGTHRSIGGEETWGDGQAVSDFTGPHQNVCSRIKTKIK